MPNSQEDWWRIIDELLAEDDLHTRIEREVEKQLGLGQRTAARPDQPDTPWRYQDHFYDCQRWFHGYELLVRQQGADRRWVAVAGGDLVPGSFVTAGEARYLAEQHIRAREQEK